MSETTGRDFQLQRRDAPPLAPHGEAEQSWHQCFESGKTFASCALVWNEIIKTRVEKVLKDLRAVHKWDPRVYVLQNWLENMVEFFHCGDRLYIDLLRQPLPEGTEPGKKPEGGAGSDVDGLHKDLSLSTNAQPLDGGQATFGDDTHLDTDQRPPSG